MPKTKISEFSATPGNNTDIDGINIAEGCAPSGINDAIRELMAQLKDFQAGTAGDSFNGPVGTTTPAAGAFTNLSASGTFALTGDQVQISEGGTGQTTANAAFNALAPSQATHAGKYLKTDGTNTSWDALDISTADITGTLPVANGGTGVTSSTGTGSVVLSASPTFTGTVNAAALTLSGAATLNGGTANGVAYLNGSKVLTTGSALSFDGAKLVNTSSVAGALIQSTDTGGTGSFLRMLGDASSGNLINWTTGTPLRFATSDSAFGSFSEQMRLTSTGLGIGTSSPSYPFHVVRNSGAGVAAQVENSTTYAHLRLKSNGTNQNAYLTFNATGTGSAVIQVNDTDRLTLDSSGNLGLGVTPSAWNADYKAIQVGANASIAGRVGTSNSFDLTANAYRDNAAGDWRYIASSGVSRYLIDGSTSSHIWLTAPSGTAGDPISFGDAKMTLTSGGNLLVGHTSDLGGLTREVLVNTASGSAGINFSVAASLTARIRSESASTEIGTVNSAPLIFNTVNTERARISSDGTFRVKGAGTAGSTDAVQFAGSAPASSLTLDASGNLLVATTNSYARLMVGSGSDFPVAKISATSSNFNSGILALGDGNSTTNNVGVWRGAANSVSSGGNYLNLGGYDGIVFAASNAAIGSQSERARIPSAGGFVVGTAALATNATTGFLYVPTCAGTPTGTPATQTGTAPIVVDTTNNKLYFYSGGQWRDAGP